MCPFILLYSAHSLSLLLILILFCARRCAFFAPIPMTSCNRSRETVCCVIKNLEKCDVSASQFLDHSVHYGSTVLSPYSIFAALLYLFLFYPPYYVGRLLIG